MAFCSNCGAKLEENSTVCSECGTNVEKITTTVVNNEPNYVVVEQPVVKKEKMAMSPISMVGLAFSIISFIFGFILITTALVKKRGIAYAEYVAMIPAFVGFGLGLYKFFDKDSEKMARFISLISAGVSLFTIFYAFIGFLVFIV